MIWFKDIFNRDVRLTDERREHFENAHPELVGQLEKIVETLETPDCVVQSRSDIHVRLFHRFYTDTSMGDKYFCVVVKTKADDAFILTAYFTDSIKKGERIWQRK